MLANRYSKEFMSSAVQKVLSRGSRSITEICNELGVSTASMYRWRVEFGTITDMKKTTRPQDRNVQDRLKSVIDYFSLPAEKRGEYLRKEGLHSDHLKSWRKQFEAPSGSSTNQAERSCRAESRRKINELEKELRRKDKALAETTALLVLKKKANLIWGTGEDE